MTDYLPPLGQQQTGAMLADIQRQLNNLQQRLNQLVIGAIESSSTSHPPNPAVGMHIYEVDTGNEYVWDGSEWVPLQLGAWTPYVVAWTSTGTAPSVGGGTLTGRSCKVGRAVTAEIRMYGGSGSVFGTGNYSFSLPFAANVTGITGNAVAWAGTWVCANTGVAFYVVGAVILQGAPSVLQGVVNSGGQFGGAAPAAWNANSTFVGTITYESIS